MGIITDRALCRLGDDEVCADAINYTVVGVNNKVFNVGE